jgi:hypothetical protein
MRTSQTPFARLRCALPSGGAAPALRKASGGVPHLPLTQGENADLYNTNSTGRAAQDDGVNLARD